MQPKLLVNIIQDTFRLHDIPMANYRKWAFDIVNFPFLDGDVGLKTLLLQGLSEPEFYGDLVYQSE